MSAYVVSNNHINAIVRFMDAKKNNQFANFGRWLFKLYDPAAIGNAIGKELLKENVRSVNYRYNEKGRAPKFVYDATPAPVAPIEMLKLINCLDYQSCERNDWHKSTANLILSAIKVSILEDLAGLNDHSGQKPIQLSYNSAPWSI